MIMSVHHPSISLIHWQHNSDTMLLKGNRQYRAETGVWKWRWHWHTSVEVNVSSELFPHQ